MPRVITLEDQINELSEEIMIRKRIYPNWVQQGKYTPEKAERKLIVMEAALDTLRGRLREFGVTHVS